MQVIITRNPRQPKLRLKGWLGSVLICGEAPGFPLKNTLSEWFLHGKVVASGWGNLGFQVFGLPPPTAYHLRPTA
jgi:hypothetical protein